jgi:hypothetical protein
MEPGLWREAARKRVHAKSLGVSRDGVLDRLARGLLIDARVSEPQ